MKNLKYIPVSLLLILLPLSSSLGQSGRIASGSDLMVFKNSDQDYLKGQQEKYASIEGSPYLDPSFSEGSILIQNKKYIGVQMRFNAYENGFEINTGEEIKYLSPKSTRIDSVWLNNEVYVYLQYRSGKATSQGFMRVAFHGPASVFLLNEVLLLQAENASGYEAAQAARFDPRPEKVYIRNGEGPALEFKGKKSLPELFPEHYRELEQYVKQEKLKLRRIPDIIQLCRYFESLV